MGTKLPSTSASSPESGENTEVMFYLQEKRAWQLDRASQGAKTCDILRYTESGGMAYYLVEPSYTKVNGLDDLPCYFDDEPKNYNRKFGSFVEEANCVFILYDVPGGMTKFDIIVFDGFEYHILNMLEDTASGRFELLAKLVKPE